MHTHKLTEISNTLLHDLDATTYDLSVLRADLQPLLPASKFWRWQIQALLRLALDETQRHERSLRRRRSTGSARDERQVARACLATLEFLDRAQETLDKCTRVVAKWNPTAPWTMACCEELHEALCGFPGIAVPEELGRYAMVRRAPARGEGGGTGWFWGLL